MTNMSLSVITKLSGRSMNARHDILDLSKSRKTFLQFDIVKWDQINTVLICFFLVFCSKNEKCLPIIIISSQVIK